jgi:hypothetical protein
MNNQWYPDKVTLDAMDGDRRSNVLMWERVARGEPFDQDVCVWLKHTAENLIDAESKPAAGGLRDRAIVRALGLEGNADKHRELRELVYVMRNFDYARQVIFQTARTGIFPAGLHSFLTYNHKDYSELDDIALLKLIDAESVKAERGWKPKT